VIYDTGWEKWTQLVLNTCLGSLQKTYPKPLLSCCCCDKWLNAYQVKAAELGWVGGKNSNFMHYNKVLSLLSNKQAGLSCIPNEPSWFIASKLNRQHLIYQMNIEHTTVVDQFIMVVFCSLALNMRCHLSIWHLHNSFEVRSFMIYAGNKMMATGHESSQCVSIIRYHCVCYYAPVSWNR
jgi:hypothetical protein